MCEGKLGAEKLEAQYYSTLSPLLRGSSIHNGISLSAGDAQERGPKGWSLMRIAEGHAGNLFQEQK